jgi:hypothetical protein
MITFWEEKPQILNRSGGGRDVPEKNAGEWLLSIIRTKAAVVVFHKKEVRCRERRMRGRGGGSGTGRRRRDVARTR